MALEVSTPKHSQYPGSRPSLQNTAMALGLGTSTPLDVVMRVGRHHNAGNDAVRMAGILVRLMALPQPVQLGVIGMPKMLSKFGRYSWRTHDGCLLWCGIKQGLIRLQRWVATVRNSTGEAGLEDYNVWRLSDLFSAHNPIAVGVDSEKRYGWVGLQSLERLAGLRGRGERSADGRPHLECSHGLRHSDPENYVQARTGRAEKKGADRATRAEDRETAPRLAQAGGPAQWAGVSST
jgi:hypothetical protein